ncbi:MAG: hypothetical protein ACRD50_10185 [Candidatus Acidiferrales bacterium]
MTIHVGRLESLRESVKTILRSHGHEDTAPHARKPGEEVHSEAIAAANEHEIHPSMLYRHAMLPDRREPEQLR